MTNVEVARPLPRLQVSAILWPTGCGVEMFRRLVARLSDGVRRAIAVAVLEAFFQREVDALIAGLARHLAPLDVAEGGIRERSVGIQRARQRLIDVTQHREVAR